MGCSREGYKFMVRARTQDVSDPGEEKSFVRFFDVLLYSQSMMDLVIKESLRREMYQTMLPYHERQKLGEQAMPEPLAKFEGLAASEVRALRNALTEELES